MNIDTTLGAVPPSGTARNPRAPGDRDDICDVCQWG